MAEKNFGGWFEIPVSNVDMHNDHMIVLFRNVAL